MPINYKEYPDNWKTEIRPAVMKRAGEVRDVSGNIIKEAKCENCKEINHAKGYRIKGHFIPEVEGAELMDFRTLKPVKRITIILTVAHLDHDKTNHDVQLDRLRAWCQRCHLNYDRHRHVANRKNNLKKKKGIIELFKEDIDAQT